MTQSLYQINKRPSDDKSDDGFSYNEEEIIKLAMNTVYTTLSSKFHQYPKLGKMFEEHCIEEAFHEIDVIIDDVADGFDESVILEAIAEDLALTNQHKQPICDTIHHILSTFTPPPRTLNLVELDTDLTMNDIENMKQMVLIQASYLKTQNSADQFLIKVLAIGYKHNFPLLTYLMDTFNRFKKLISMPLYDKLKQLPNDRKRRSFIAKKFKPMEIRDFFKKCKSLKYLLSKSMEYEWIKRDLRAYNTTIITLFRRMWPSFNYLNINHPVYKINDGLEIFVIYYISALLSINKLITDSFSKLPLQIDIWIIPKAVTERSNEHNLEDNDSDEDDYDLDDIKQSADLNEMLENIDNLEKIEIENSQKTIDKMMDIFDGVYRKIIKYQRGKRMIIIIDRRNNNDDNDNDTLYAYLPQKMKHKHYRDMTVQDIPNGIYLDEVMLIFTKLKVLHESDDTYWKYGDTNCENMFLISIHIHKQDLVRLYWCFGRQYTRFYIHDMIDLWPLYFINNKKYKIDENGRKKRIKFDDQMDDVDIKPIVKLVHSMENNNPLKDDNFDEFFRINTSMNVRKSKALIINNIAMKHLVDGYMLNQFVKIKNDNTFSTDLRAMIKGFIGSICSCPICLS